MIQEIDLEIHGQDLRSSCLADYIEAQSAKGIESFTEADLADRIDDSDWHRLLEPKFTGGELGVGCVRTGEKQDYSREAAKRVFAIISQRSHILGDKYPFETLHGRLKCKQDEGLVYLWFLFVSLIHGFKLKGVPDPALEFEKVVAHSLDGAGLPSMTVGTANQGKGFKGRIFSITQRFPHLVEALDGVVHSRHANDGGIDTFGSFLCGNDTRHGHWAFIGQATVGKSDIWKQKIQEAFPNFWRKVFSERIVAIPFFATPHHIQDDYLALLFQNNERCLLDRIRLTQWTQKVPDSFLEYKNAIEAVELQ